MINYLRIDGFKSLKDFRITLTKGLNVLIGPNGAGKSNICQALGLIAATAEDNLANYIVLLGGVKAVFTKGPRDDLTRLPSKKMNLYCRGKTTCSSGNKKVVELRYKYKVSLVVKQEQLLIARERLRLYTLRPGREPLLILEARRVALKVKIHIPDTSQAGPLSSIVQDQRDWSTDIAEGPLNSIFPIVQILSYYCYVVREDMMFAKAWNIDPHLARQESDILHPFVMLPNGERLSNALHHLFEHRKESVEDLNAFMAEILPGFKKIGLETWEDRLTRSFFIMDANGITCAPSCLSDGTIKALALLVGVFGQPNSTSIIEEPENYLHPLAAHALIEFFRGYFTNGVCVLTTHSETVLNALRPSEIIVIENKGGHTKQTRITRQIGLASAIRKSGFGPGYHYLAGSIGGVPFD